MAYCPPRNQRRRDQVYVSYSRITIISIVQLIVRNTGPGLSDRTSHKIIFHPSTGLCILKKPVKGVQLGNCLESNHWTCTPQHTLRIKGSYLCLQAQGLNLPARLSTLCPGREQDGHESQTRNYIFQLHWAGGVVFVWMLMPNNNLFTTTCKCLSKDNNCDPGSQWFKFVDTNDIITIRVVQQVGTLLKACNSIR